MRRAGRSAVHGQFPERRDRQERRFVRETRGVLPGDAALPGLRQPTKIRVVRAFAKRDVHAPDGTQVLRGVTRDEGVVGASCYGISVMGSLLR